MVTETVWMSPLSVWTSPLGSDCLGGLVVKNRVLAVTFEFLLYLSELFSYPLAQREGWRVESASSAAAGPTQIRRWDDTWRACTAEPCSPPHFMDPVARIWFRARRPTCIPAGARFSGPDFAGRMALAFEAVNSRCSRAEARHFHRVRQLPWKKVVTDFC